MSRYASGHYDGDGCTFPDPGHFAESGARPGKPYLSDDDIERADCRRREPPCGIVGKHAHGDRVGTFCGEPEPRPTPPGE